MSKEDLKSLIEKYFNGETSTKEEAVLLRMLLNIKNPDSTEREALATLTFMKYKPSKKTSAPFRKIAVAISAAIVTSAIMFTGIYSYLHMERPTEGWVAYAGGEKIDNYNEINNLLGEQLKELSNASSMIDDELKDDFNEFQEAFKQL